jgi:acyl CoA:acetate/3-ketoacid CoA transferase alpha subunit
MHSTHRRAARRLYVRETWLKADLAIVKARRADPAGNLMFRKPVPRGELVDVDQLPSTA